MTRSSSDSFDISMRPSTTSSHAVDTLVGHAEADRALVLVRLALGEQAPRLLLAALEPVELERDRAVPVEAEPAQRLLDLLRRLGDLAGRVRVLDPQPELAAVVTGKKPVEERRAHVPDDSIRKAVSPLSGAASAAVGASASATLRATLSRTMR